MPLTSVDIERRQIWAFVLSEPHQIQLLRPRRVETSSGGVTLAGNETLPEQTFRLVPFKRRLTREWGFTREGEAMQLVEWILVGAYDADVQRKDHFWLNNWHYEVEFLSDHRLYRTAVGLTIRGEKGSE